MLSMDIGLCQWAAGFFDGEGCVMISRQPNANTHVLSVVVANCEQEVLEPLLAWGSKIALVNNRSRSKNSRPSFRWAIQSQKAAVFLRDIQPFVRSYKNKERIALALEFQEGKPRQGCKPTPERRVYELDVRERIQVLNKRGV
jgi:hypothetical protein